jgi:putative PIN family toxin of toxin-antitoxin system
MPRPRIVVDTNILVSAALQPAGLPAGLIELIGFRAVTLCLSEEILAEYREVFRRPKFARIDPERVARLLDLVAAEAVMAQPVRRSAASPDEPDNRFIECAEASHADYLVTGNTKHFPRRHGTTEVVTVRQFLNLITPLKK